MEVVTFKAALCSLYQLNEESYKTFMLRRTLFRRVKFVSTFIQFFYPDFLFNEKRLVDKVGKAHNLREIQEEVDFYQHKYVVNSAFKDALKFRISGMRIMSLANKAFAHAAANRQPS
jgi:hypothetical protein